MDDIQITTEQEEWVLTQSYTRLMHKKYEECLVLLNGLDTLKPGNPHVYSMMSYAYLLTDYPEESLKMVDKYLKCATPEQCKAKEIAWIKDRAQLRIEKKLKDNDSNDSADVS